MIDKLKLNIPFKSEHIWLSSDQVLHKIDTFKLAALGIPVNASKIELSDSGDYVATKLSVPYHKVGSDDNGAVFKIHDETRLCDPYVELKASPAKLMHRHNVYGSECPSLCGQVLIDCLIKAYPDLVPLLDFKNTELSEIDCTYSARLPSESHVKQLVGALHNVSNGQTKARTGYESTAYFGKVNSRIFNAKIYAKYLEVLKEIAKADREGREADQQALESVLEYALNLIRFEATIKKRWLERRDLPTNFFQFCEYATTFEQTHNKPFVQHLFQHSMTKIFDSFEGRTMINYDDDSVRNLLKAKYGRQTKKGMSYNAALAVFRTYRALRFEGWDATKESMSETTFYRHLR